jgi:opacity protein-like surface antigen
MNFNNQNTANAFGGAQLGYNWQWTPSWVLGIEADLGGMAVNLRPFAHGATYWTDSSGNIKGIGTPVMFDGEGNGGFYGDITGRVGYTWGTWMIYAKGGFAWLNASLNMHEHVLDSYGAMTNAGVASCVNGWCDFNQNNSNTLTGWTVGGGVEWKVSASWSLKVEYLHFDFTNFNNNCCNDWYSQQGWGVNNFNNNNNKDLTVDSVKIGFNYFWNPAPPAPLK